MAIEAFGLAETSTGSATSSIKIESGSTAPSDVYMRWHTMQGAGVIKAFDMAVSVRRVLKSNGTNSNGGGGVSDTQYGDWSDWYYEQVPIAQCTPVADSTGYNYAHTLNLAGMYAKEGLSNNGFNFTSRQNDEMHFQIKIKAIYEPTWANAWNNGVLASAVTYSEAWIGWIPQYTIASASFDSTGDLTVKFNRPNWMRTDDTWTLTNLVNDGYVVTKNKPVSGLVGNGTIKIPRGSFSHALNAGASVFSFVINASYKSKGYELTTCEGDANVADLSKSSTPTVTVQQFDKSLGVNVRGVYPPYIYNGLDYSSVFDAQYYIEHNPDVVNSYGTDPSRLLEHFINFGMAEGRRGSESFNVYEYRSLHPELGFGDDLPAWYDYYVREISDQSEATYTESTTFDIKLRGYGDETDSFTGVSAGTYDIPFPPLDVPFYIDVRGHGINSQSVIVSKGPYTIPSANLGTVIQDVDNPSNATSIFYGTVGKRSGSRDVNVVKLAGRNRSSAYFGAGASVSEMVQGKLIDKAGIELGAPEKLEKLATTGKVVMVRKPGGYRHRCVITKFTAQRGCVSPVVEVQLSLTEVD